MEYKIWYGKEDIINFTSTLTSLGYSLNIEMVFYKSEESSNGWYLWVRFRGDELAIMRLVNFIQMYTSCSEV